MVTLLGVLELLNRSKGKILSRAEMAMSESQYKAFRREILNILGREGMERDLADLFANEGQQGRARKGQE